MNNAERQTYALAILIVLITVLSLYSIHNAESTYRLRSVVATIPGIKSDIETLLDGCNVSITTLVPSGVDPHHYNLDTKSVIQLSNALAVVSTGHAPFEIQLRELGLDGRLFEISNISGLTYYNIPGNGLNIHMPIYDPDNYKIYITSLAYYLQEIMPSCKNTIEINLYQVLVNLSKLEVCRNLFSNTPGVAASPFTQYAVEWMGIDLRLILSSGEEASLSPHRLSYAKDLLANGAIAVIAVDEDLHPIDQANQWLYNEAVKLDSRIIYVLQPSTQESTLSKIQFTCDNTINTGTSMIQGNP